MRNRQVGSAPDTEAEVYNLDILKFIDEQVVEFDVTMYDAGVVAVLRYTHAHTSEHMHTCVCLCGRMPCLSHESWHER